MFQKGGINMNEEMCFNYIAGNYEITIKGSREEVFNELDRLLDFYCNEMEAYSYNSGNNYVEMLKDDGFNVEVTENE